MQVGGDRHKLAGNFGPDLTAGKLYQLFGGERVAPRESPSSKNKTITTNYLKTRRTRLVKEAPAGAFHVWSGALDDASAGGRR